jgi:hypothetical protein
MKLRYLFALLFIQNVICLETDGKDVKTSYYETNYVMSDVENLPLTTCNTIEDCPPYATECKDLKELGITNLNNNIKICNFEFKCRANYRCIVPGNTKAVLLKSNSTSTEMTNTKTLNANDFIVSDKEVGYIIRSCQESDCLTPPCSANEDCYSNNCEKKECRVNKDMREYYCGFPIYEVKKGDNSTIKLDDITKSKCKYGKSKDQSCCRYDKEQTCSNNKDCFTDKCDYSGVCVPDYLTKSKIAYENEKKHFYIFLGIVSTFIVIVITGSFYYNRKYIRQMEDEEKKRRLLNNNDNYVENGRKSFKKK